MRLLLVLIVLLAVAVTIGSSTRIDSHTPDAVERLIVDHVRRVLAGNTSDPNTHHDPRQLGDARSGSRRHRRGRRHNIGMATMLRGAGGGGDSINTPSNMPSFPPMPPPPPPPAALRPMQTGCAWSVTVTAATYNVAFPDLNCVYQVLLYWGLSGKTALRIEGRFPRVRYFSFQSYDVASGQPLASIVDYDIEPRTGVNPFQEPPHGDAESTGTYRVHLTDTGDHGLQNELTATSAGGKPQRRCHGRECLTLVIMRLYTANPDKDAFHGSRDGADQQQREWGYVPAPVVTIRYGTQVNRRTGRATTRSKTLAPCDPHKTTLAKSFLDWKVPQLQHDWEGTTPLDNEDDNFIVYTPASSSRALFANADANYLFATAKNNRTHEGKQLVARITGHLPTVARGFSAYPRIAERYEYEARYVSLSTIAMRGAGPVIDTVMDAAIEQRQFAKRRQRPLQDEDEHNEEYSSHHHHQQQQQQQHHHHHHKHHYWKAHAPDPDPRGFSVVAAPSPEFLEGCPPQVYEGGRDLFLTTVERGQLYPPMHLAFLYRQILSQWQTSGRQDRSIARAKHECLGRREKGLCHLRSFFIDLMGPQYPRIKYYYCWRNVTRGCSCEKANGQPVMWEVEPEPPVGEPKDDGEDAWGHEFDEFFHEHHPGHYDEEEGGWDEWWTRSASEMRGSENGSSSSGGGSSSGGSSGSSGSSSVEITNNVSTAFNSTSPVNGTIVSINNANGSIPTIHVNDSALADCHYTNGCRSRPIIVPLHRIRVVDVPEHRIRANISHDAAVAAVEGVATANATKEMGKERKGDEEN